MGLFGGFKGKLIGNNKKEKKEKKEGKNQVVCVKFHTFSEFDSDSAGPSHNSNPVRNEVANERTRPTKADVKNLFETQNRNVKPEERNHATSVKPEERNHATSVKPEEKKHATSVKPAEKKHATSVKPAEKKHATSVKPEEKKHATSVIKPEERNHATSVIKPEEKNHATSVIKPEERNHATSAVNPIAETPKKREAFKSFLKMQAPKRPPIAKAPESKEEIFADPPTPIPVTKTIQFPLESDDSDEDDDDGGNFKIHFAGNVNHNFDISDGSSVDEVPEMSPMIYSSQATSIFFGGDEEPTVTRPRNIGFHDAEDDMSDGSSASA